MSTQADTSGSDSQLVYTLAGGTLTVQQANKQIGMAVTYTYRYNPA